MRGTEVAGFTAVVRWPPRYFATFWRPNKKPRLGRHFFDLCE
jgi:hypothetical protein